MLKLVEKLERNHALSKEEFIELIENRTKGIADELHEHARAVSRRHFGTNIYIRGLIEFTNHCKNNCYYCGIRTGNKKLERYRLTKEEIMRCCKQGYALGFRTFVLQGGEDPYFTDERMVEIISAIRNGYPECAITLSIGELPQKSYEKMYKAGANRFLLRHETADDEHYSQLHPYDLTLENRKKCLYQLKEIGYQVGTGFMVGAPYQTVEHLAQDLLFIRELSPQMVGIGPFIPHIDTPFADEQQGNYELCLYLISIIRLMLPNALLPATTALGTANQAGREKGILAGANVVMPNLSPVTHREKYSLYNNKLSTGEEAAEGFAGLKRRIEEIGYEIVQDRGDYRPLKFRTFRWRMT